MAAEPASR